MATVYDKSSLFLAPSGVNDGTVFVQKPVPIYGSEQVTNGDFSTDSDWTKGTGWSIANGKATFENSGGADDLTQTCLESGKTYLLTFDTLEVNGGNFAYAIGGSYTFINNIEANKTHRVIATAGSTLLRLRGPNNFNGSIDNVSIKEVLVDGADFDFTRGSNLSATRVNQAGLIEKGRENLLLHSNQFDTGWPTSNASFTSGQSGYDGRDDAWLLTSSLAGGRIQLSRSDTGVNTTSAYFKKGSANGVWLRIDMSGTDANVYVNLIDGSKINSTGEIATKISDVGNGWYRIELAANWINVINIRIYPTDTSGVAVAGSIYIQNAQLEQGLVATPYIPTTATTGKAGLLENTPRLDYSGGATCPSLLLEPGRTNSLIQSEYLKDSSTWSQLETIVTQNEIVSPEGVQNASKLLCVSGFANHQIDAMNVSISSGAVTGSVYAKKGANADWLRLRLSGTSNPPRAWFDLQNGVVGDVDATGTASIEDIGDGWYRCSLTEAGNTASGGGGRLQIFINKIDSQTQFTSNGDEYHYIYGAQMEQGSYPTSYIPTYGTSQTRAGELYENKNINNFINTANGFSFYYEISNFSQTDSSFSDYFSFKASDSNSPNIRCELRTDGSAGIFATGITGWNTINLTNWTTSGETTQKLLIVITNNSQKAYLNGVEGLDSSAASIVLPTFQQLVTENFFGQTALMKFSVNQAILFPAALSDLDAKILTGATTYETFDEMALALNYTVYE